MSLDDTSPTNPQLQKAAEDNIEDAIWRALDLSVTPERIRELVEEALEEATA